MCEGLRYPTVLHQMNHNASLLEQTANAIYMTSINRQEQVASLQMNILVV
jgi:hypothetical protein